MILLTSRFYGTYGDEWEPVTKGVFSSVEKAKEIILEKTYGGKIIKEGIGFFCVRQDIGYETDYDWIDVELDTLIF